MRRTALAIALLALVVLGGAAPAGAGEQLRGFHGNLAGAATFVPTTDPACTALPFKTDTDAAGTVSHMGPVTMESLHCSGNYISGTMVLHGMRGDLTLAYSGPCTPYVPGVTTLVECNLGFTVAGGTDAYDGAGGSGHITATVIPQPDPTPWPADFTLTGRVSY